ncbi:hypothetical protein JKF63_05124 [Porcisia hertigi]|uniref:Uncharacterized protein n=1 Tax=Porcisia hertigi TaxID=2761500 RepID=A0A836IPW0_9TRYP|nr:hypothetical protein JKF63_05124 [Porcisia hertigi]
MPQLSAAPALTSVQLRRRLSNRLATLSQTAIAMLCSLVAVLIVSGVLPGAQAAEGPATFRCLKPFSSMDSFQSVAKLPLSQNCDYVYFTVKDARAELSCVSPAAAAVSSETTCNVTVRWSMQRASDVETLLKRQVGTDSDYFAQEANEGSAPTPPNSIHDKRSSPMSFLTEDEDVWRYAVSLKSKGHSTINYKGFNNGDGYSLCCDALEEAICVWAALHKGDNDMATDEHVDKRFLLQPRRTLWSCPLPFPTPHSAADGGSAGGDAGSRVELTDLDEEDNINVFHGVITKPLHRMVEGPWEVIIQMWRRRQRISPVGTGSSSPPSAGHSIESEQLGRIVIPFTVNVDALRRQGRIAHVPNVARSVENTGEVMNIADEQVIGEAADL